MRKYRIFIWAVLQTLVTFFVFSGCSNDKGNSNAIKDAMENSLNEAINNLEKDDVTITDNCEYIPVGRAEIAHHDPFTGTDIKEGEIDNWIFLAIKKNGKFLKFDNDKDYSSLGKYVCFFADCKDEWRGERDNQWSLEEMATIQNKLTKGVHEYLLGNKNNIDSSIKHLIEKAHYDYKTDERIFNEESSRYNYKYYRSTDKKRGYSCKTPEEARTSDTKHFETVNGEILPEDALLIDWSIFP